MAERMTGQFHSVMAGHCTEKTGMLVQQCEVLLTWGLRGHHL